MNKPRILVIEDDSAVRNLISTMLETQQDQYKTAATGKDGVTAVLSYRPDVIILDLGLPDMDGAEVIKKTRSWSATPIIIVSARGDDSDKVEALDAGADDYITKPFSVDELMARIRVAMRRARAENSQTATESNTYLNGALKIDYAAGCAFIEDKELHLTPMEYRLLVLLAKNTGKVLTYNYIAKEIWGTPLPDDTQSLRVFMATLRKKIEKDTSDPQYIQTHIRVGYRMIKVTDKECRSD